MSLAPSLFSFYKLATRNNKPNFILWLNYQRQQTICKVFGPYRNDIVLNKKQQVQLLKHKKNRKRHEKNKSITLCEAENRTRLDSVKHREFKISIPGFLIMWATTQPLPVKV